MGTYVLAMWLDAPRTISIGRLGRFDFPSGWYLYVGSAQGPGGVQARLLRHWRRFASGKRAHWHVDHLREHAVWGGAWACCSGQRLECTWADAVHCRSDASIVARGFGASDCRCPAHLIRVASIPGENWFASILGAERIDVTPNEIDELLEVLVSASEESREEAALALGRFGAAAGERLAAALVTGEADARWWMARALAEVGGEGVVPPLIGILDDPDADVRACAALALGRIGDGSAAPALADRLDDESAFVASIAADALSMLGECAVEALAGRLADQNPHIRLLAVRALGRIRSQSAIGPLFGVLEDSSYLVRYYAQEALDAMGVGMVLVAP
jgi:HEAT repeat protein/Uri superfamily endonuclease